MFSILDVLTFILQFYATLGVLMLFILMGVKNEQRNSLEYVVFFVFGELLLKPSWFEFNLVPHLVLIVACNVSGIILSLALDMDQEVTTTNQQRVRNHSNSFIATTWTPIQTRITRKTRKEGSQS